MNPRNDPKYLFTLRVKLDRDSTLIVHAFEGPFDGRHHTRIDVEATLLGDTWPRTVIFPRGATYCGLPGYKALDGDDARELVLALLAMKPGDTDEDYFADYTAEQRAFATKYGETIDRIRYDRYGDR